MWLLSRLRLYSRIGAFLFIVLCFSTDRTLALSLFLCFSADFTLGFSLFLWFSDDLTLVFSPFLILD